MGRRSLSEVCVFFVDDGLDGAWRWGSAARFVGAWERAEVIALCKMRDFLTFCNRALGKRKRRGLAGDLVFGPRSRDGVAQAIRPTRYRMRL